MIPRASLHLGHAHKEMHFIHGASVARGTYEGTTDSIQYPVGEL